MTDTSGDTDSPTRAHSGRRYAGAIVVSIAVTGVIAALLEVDVADAGEVAAMVLTFAAVVIAGLAITGQLGDG